MQIWDTARIREWDQYTISNEPITSLDLMERAATACFQWLVKHHYSGRPIAVFCGKGNNGGDGLALARLLAEHQQTVQVYVLETGHKGTPDFQENLTRLHSTRATLHFLSSPHLFPVFAADTVIIDALLGTGLQKPLDGLAQTLVEWLNASGKEIISIDLPTGLFADRSSRGHTVIHATHTLSFQCYKLAFLLPENESHVGNLHILDIGLHPDFPKLHRPLYHFIDRELITDFLKERKLFSHKGQHGHAALVVGSKGMMGAAVLAAQACLRSGIGKLTCYIPPAGLEILQVAVPEALCQLVDDGANAVMPSWSNYSAVGIGPGIGTSPDRVILLSHLLKEYPGKIIIDADALNILAQHPELKDDLTKTCVITPHPGEWERLAGKSADDFERLARVQEFARQHHCVVVLKGRYTFIAAPDGSGYFNTTGNNGLAKAGTGDVLTGIITAFCGQGYTPLQAAQLGVYLHGLTADLAIRDMTAEALMASDLIERLGQVDLRTA